MDNTVSLSFAVVGVVELIKRVFDKDYKTAAIIAGAAAVGALGGFAVGIPWIAGLVIGLEGSGVITAASYIGKRGTPAVAPTV